jgi:hypothetical protein
MIASFTSETFGLFDRPQKAVWSAHHRRLFVLGERAAYTLDPEDGAHRTFYASETHRLADLDVATDGHVLLLLQPLGGQRSYARIMRPDLVGIRMGIRSVASQFQRGVFLQQGKALVAGEINLAALESSSSSSSSASSSQSESESSPSFSESSSSSTESSSSSHSGTTSSSSSGADFAAVRFYLLDYRNATVTSQEAGVSGSIVALLQADTWDRFALAVSAGGDVLAVPTGRLARQHAFGAGGAAFDGDVDASESSAESESAGRSSSSSGLAGEIILHGVANLGIGVTAAALGAHAGPSPGASPPDPAAQTQALVRVFVGSRPWQNDRWDSGVLATSKTSVLYGGGDNLEPGQSYWVHILTSHDGKRWSRPQIKKFIVPLE